MNDSLTLATCELEQAARRGLDDLTVEEMTAAAKKLAKIEGIVAAFKSAIREKTNSSSSAVD